MSRKTDAAVADWGLGDAERWDADWSGGTLMFTFPDRRVTAPFQVIGTYSLTEKSWLWTWANAVWDLALAQHSGMVRAFGESERHPVLVKPKLFCTEYECWELTALACHLADAPCVYRAPSDDMRVFMTFGPVTVHPLS